MDEVRGAVRSATVVAVLLVAAAAGPLVSEAQSLCDPNGDGVISISDGVQVLRAAAQLPSLCNLDACDANGDGAITVGDGVNVLRAAASLASACDNSVTPTPTVTPTPGGPVTTAVKACDDDCQAAQQVCGDEVFFADYDSVAACTDDCVEIVDDYASDVDNFAGCVDAQVRYIECCTHRRQCGVIPDGCDREFSGAVNACGGSFGGCPLIFFGE
jgi:hypothetical protein